MWQVAAACFVVGVGLGLTNVPTLVAMQSVVGWAHRGVVTATNMFSRSIGSAVGVAVFGAVANAAYGSTSAQLGTSGSDSVPHPVALYDATHHVFVGLVVVALLLGGRGAAGPAPGPRARRGRAVGLSLGSGPELLHERGQVGRERGRVAVGLDDDAPSWSVLCGSGPAAALLAAIATRCPASVQNRPVAAGTSPPSSEPAHQGRVLHRERARDERPVPLADQHVRTAPGRAVASSVASSRAFSPASSTWCGLVLGGDAPTPGRSYRQTRVVASVGCGRVDPCRPR